MTHRRLLEMLPLEGRGLDSVSVSQGLLCILSLFMPHLWPYKRCTNGRSNYELV